MRLERALVPWHGNRLFHVPAMHVLTVDRQPARVVLTIESAADLGGLPGVRVVAVGQGSRGTRRLAHGFRIFDHYRMWILL